MAIDPKESHDFRTLIWKVKIDAKTSSAIFTPFYNTVVRKFAILVSFGILVVFVALELQSNARVWYSH